MRSVKRAELRGDSSIRLEDRTKGRLSIAEQQLLCTWPGSSLGYITLFMYAKRFSKMVNRINSLGPF